MLFGSISEGAKSTSEGWENWLEMAEFTDMPVYGVIWKMDASHLVLASATRVSFASQLRLILVVVRKDLTKMHSGFIMDSD